MSDKANNNTQRPTFNRWEWSLGVGFILFCALGILAASVSHSQSNAVERFNNNASMMLRAVGEKMVELRGVKRALLGMHYASDEFAGSDIEAFAEQTQRYAPYVEGVGLYSAISGSLREEYEAYTSASRNHPFVIHTYGPDGEVMRHDQREEYFPVTSVHTNGHGKHEFLGTDLAAEPAIAAALYESIESGEGLLIATPGHWPISGAAVFLHPIYLAEGPPDTGVEREELHGGGIWVEFNIETLFSGKFHHATGLLEVGVDSHSNGEVLLYSRDGGAAVAQSLFEFGDSSTARNFTLGDSTIKVRISETLRATQREVFISLMASLLGFLLASALLGVVYQRRVTTAEKIRSLEVVKSEREYAERTLGSISDSVVSIGLAGDLRYLNESACECLGVPKDVSLGRHFDDLLPLKAVEDDAPLDFAKLVSRLTNKESLTLDVCVNKAEHREATYKLTMKTMLAGHRASAGYICVLQDVSRDRELTAELERRAHHDALTGCYNRFYFERILNELVDGAYVSGRRHSLLYIDLDQFKIVNDTAGHSAGDQLLCELTRGLNSSLRENDILARLGGDEFGILIVDAAPVKAHEIAEGIYSWFQNAVFNHEGNAFPIRGSIGLVDISAERCNIKDIMSAADVACYTAKDAGRNSLVVYSDTDESMSERKAEMNWLPRLEKALERDEFSLLVQPIHRASTDAMSASTRHFEFLLRLQEGDELVTPGRFIQAAERYDLMKSIDRLVIEKSMQMVSSIAHSLVPGCSFAVNLSGQSAADPELLQFITEQFEKHAVDPAWFWFEITETAAISQFANAVELIDGIHALGAKVALDDFGAGLSSFGYLRELPVDVLKIDGRFVKDAATSEVAREMVRAMDHVAKTIGLETVAEFVEDQAVFDTLVEMGITYLQGYLIGYPGEFYSTVEQSLKQDRAA